MTRSQAKSLLPVISAWSSGETVQASIGGEDWEDQIGDDMDFDNRDLKWRVKPGEFWVVFNRMTAEVCCRHTSPPKVDNNLYYVRREVVE